MSNKKIIEKRELNFSNKYGTKNPSQILEVKEKKRLKSQERYGTNNPNQAEKVKKQKIETSRKNCGEDHFMKTKEGKEKVKQGCLKNLGYDNPSKSPKVIEKRNQTNKELNRKNLNRPKEIEEKKRLIFRKNYGKDNPSQSSQIKEKRNKTNLERRGIDNIFRDIDYIHKCIFKKYGVDSIMKLQEFVDKAKQTRIKNGTQTPDNQLSYFRIYYRLVYYFTNLSLQKKYSKEELGKRKSTGIMGGMNADHRFSIMEGFKQNILPCIIGCQSNLELLAWRVNLVKGIRCSITKEQLFELYEQETKSIK